MTKRKAKRPLNITNVARLPTPSEFLKFAEEKEKRDRKRSEFWTATIIGGRGTGKSYSSLRLAENIKREEEKRIFKTNKEEVDEVATDGNAQLLSAVASRIFTAEAIMEAQFNIGRGGGNEGGSGFIPQQPIYIDQQNPWWQDGQQAQQSYSWSYDQKTPNQKKEEVKKPEYAAEDFKGRFCAVVEMTLRGLKDVYTGVLFVKKCGHWKLMDFNGNKLVGGKAGSFEEQLKDGTMKLEIHRILFDAEPPKINEMDLEIT